MSTFTSLVVREESSVFSKKLEQRSFDDLPKHPILIRVKYSSLNYKDALSSHGNKGITRNFPHTPGIDAVGVIEKSTDATWKVGEEVIVTGFDLGMNTSGGLSQYISVPAEWLVKKPTTLTTKETMIYGTAGFTAGIGIEKMLRNGLTPSMGEVVITGATGGVGILAIAILSKIGFSVVAATGKKELEPMLLQAGATRTIHRDEVIDKTGKPLLRSLWAGVFDTVGGDYLSSLIKTTKKEGTVVVTGLVSSPTLNTTVFPLIMNGINIVGVNSADCPAIMRSHVWNKLSSDWKPTILEKICEEITLEQVPTYLDRMIKGGAIGKTVVKIN